MEITGKVFDALSVVRATSRRAHPAVRTGDRALADTVVEDNNLNKLIAALRRALGDAETYIVTVPDAATRWWRTFV